MVLNCTLELRDENEVSQFIHWIKGQETKVIDYVILPDTNKLYETDETFRQLVKEYKKVKSTKNKYIQKHLN